MFFAAKDGEALYSQQKQDPELTVAQIMNSLLPNSDLKKVGKTTRPFRYNLNQIPDDYTIEVRNRFKGLDLIDRVPDELWTEVHDTVQETGIKTILKKKKCKKGKCLSEEGLQTAVKRREAKSKGEKERYTHLNAEFRRIPKRYESLPQATYMSISRQMDKKCGTFTQWNITQPLKRIHSSQF